MASSIARSAAAVSAVADGATPSSATASAAASRRAAGSRIDVLEVGDPSASSSALIRSTAFCPAMTEVYHVYVVQQASAAAPAGESGGLLLAPGKVVTLQPAAGHDAAAVEPEVADAWWSRNEVGHRDARGGAVDRWASLGWAGRGIQRCPDKSPARSRGTAGTRAVQYLRRVVLAATAGRYLAVSAAGLGQLLRPVHLPEHRFHQHRDHRHVVRDGTAGRADGVRHRHLPRRQVLHAEQLRRAQQRGGQRVA